MHGNNGRLKKILPVAIGKDPSHSKGRGGKCQFLHKCRLYSLDLNPNEIKAKLLICLRSPVFCKHKYTINTAAPETWFFRNSENSCNGIENTTFGGFFSKFVVYK